MKLLHVLKGGKKTNVIPLENIGFSTRHTQIQGKITHEGWAIRGEFTDKEHKYIMLFDVEDAREFHKWLGKMLPRFETTSAEGLAEFINKETHD